MRKLIICILTGVCVILLMYYWFYEDQDYYSDVHNDVRGFFSHINDSDIDNAYVFYYELEYKLFENLRRLTQEVNEMELWLLQMNQFLIKLREPVYTRVFLGNFKLTAYCLCIICCEHYSYQHPRNRYNPNFIQTTASGTIPEVDRTIAVDRSQIPFGTRVYIEGVGWRIAEDVGGAINRNIIDVFKPSHDAALQFGVRRNIPVYAYKKVIPWYDAHLLCNDFWDEFDIPYSLLESLWTD